MENEITNAEGFKAAILYLIRFDFKLTWVLYFNPLHWQIIPVGNKAIFGGYNRIIELQGRFLFIGAALEIQYPSNKPEENLVYNPEDFTLDDLEPAHRCPHNLYEESKHTFCPTCGCLMGDGLEPINQCEKK